ncbi:putative lipoprotein [Vibrio cholerae]|nr:putative lipoprotein [Vibrio cholerae]
MELGSAKLGDYEQGYQKGLEQYCKCTKSLLL